VISSYREHGQALARGVPAKALMAELFGKATGCSKGKGGSMHLFDAGRRFMGGHGIVGGHIPLAAGLGFAIKYRGGDQICLCYFGEAAVNIGAFHEALNMASVWKLPIIFCCENNRYGMGTAFERVAAVTDVVEHACSYDMAAELVNGMDVMAVYGATERAAEVRAVVEAAVQFADQSPDPDLSELTGHVLVECRADPHLPGRARPGAARGDAARSQRVPHGRGGGGLSRRLPGEPRAAGGI